MFLPRYVFVCVNYSTFYIICFISNGCKCVGLAYVCGFIAN
jgi:hypothetical protein